MEKQPVSKKELRRRRRRKVLIMKSLILAGMILILGIAIFFLTHQNRSDQEEKDSVDNEVVEENTDDAEQADKEKQDENKEDKEKEDKKEANKVGPESDKQLAIAEADRLAASYDYDAAVERLNQVPGGENDQEIQGKITSYQTQKASCVPVNINEVTHIFYHSLIVDPELGFAGDDGLSAGFKQWMTTVEEFNRITQTMYDNGYVLVRLRDLVIETKDENGNSHFVPNSELKLPPGKKAFVMSMDDLSYYHSYDGKGIATKLILNDEGLPVCEYIQRDGTTVVGAYDHVPLLDEFIEAHPDASYRGAKGMIALTGYNGVLGYRTDIAYKTGENLTPDQQAWLDAHPDFDWDKEVAEATKVADGMKADGWEFASHTWGHVHIADVSLERVQTDTTNWRSYVEPIVGPTDTIIFAHGQDLADWHDYAPDNEKFQYLKSQGYNYFCNVDSSQYFLQIRDNYVRQGRRNLDGYRLWNDVHGEHNRTSDLFDASKILDERRTDVPDL